jgi:hypothetical protein
VSREVADDGNGLFAQPPQQQQLLDVGGGGVVEVAGERDDRAAVPGGLLDLHGAIPWGWPAHPWLA